MYLGIIFAILVAILWSLGEVKYTKLSRDLDRANVYLYQYLARSIVYILVVVIFDIGLFMSFQFDHLRVFLPIILCDLFASYVVNIAVVNGKLSVVSPIMAAYPIVDIILGILLLKEKISIIELVLALIITASIVMLAMNQTKTKRAPHPIKGIIFSCVYMLLIAFSAFFEKSVYMSDFSMFELYYYKGIIYFLTSVFFMMIVGVSKVKLKKPNRKILDGSCITPIGNVMNSFALTFGNMVIVTPISSMYSVLTHLISVKVLKEKISIKERVCVSLILVSTILLIILGLVL